MTTQEKAIEQLERISTHLSSIGEKEDYTDVAIEALEHTRWIPVSENKKPEHMERVITTIRYEVSYVLPWKVVQENLWIDDGDGDAHFEQDNENVIAWMPLPQPYKVEGSDD